FGKTYLHKLLREVRKVTGGKIDANVTQRVLGNMGIELTNREVNELLKRLPIADDGKILKNILFDHVKWFSGGKCYVSKLDSILEELDYELEEEEIEDLKNRLPIEDGKVKLNKMMENVESLTGSKVNVDGVDGVLKNIGIAFTPKERWELLKTLPVTSDGNVYRNRLFSGVKTFHRGKGFISKVETIMENLSYNVGKKDMKGLRSFLKSDDTGKFSLSSLVNAANLFSGDKINAEDIQPYLESLGIELSDSESQMIQSIVPVDDENMVYKNVVMDILRTHRSECKVF
ncbi:hypothetical protein LEMLEM_LOCUS27590, partial [Lemmus lemmus]